MLISGVGLELFEIMDVFLVGDGGVVGFDFDVCLVQVVVYYVVVECFLCDG